MPALAGIRQLLGLIADAPIEPGLVSSVKMGHHRRHERPAGTPRRAHLLLVNQGFADIVRIGHQARPDLFALILSCPSCCMNGWLKFLAASQRMAACSKRLMSRLCGSSWKTRGPTGLNHARIALIHAWAHPAQEARIAELARQAGFAQVSASHAVSPLLRLVPRAETAVADAYLSPVLRRHIGTLAASLGDKPLFLMQSHGRPDEGPRFLRQGTPILSGPAGGIIGAVRTAAWPGSIASSASTWVARQPTSRFTPAALERSFETEIAESGCACPCWRSTPLRPAAARSFMLWTEGFALGRTVPAPIRDQRVTAMAGRLQWTDANVCVGKIQPSRFSGDLRPSGRSTPRFCCCAHEVHRTGGPACPQRRRSA